MDMAIRIDNRYLKDVKNNDCLIRDLLFSYFSATPNTFHLESAATTKNLQTQTICSTNSTRLFHQLTFSRPTPKSDNHMDIDFVRRGSLSFMEREHRVKQGLCLVCGKSWVIEKQLAQSPDSSLIQIHQGISTHQTESTKQQNSREQIQLPLRKQVGDRLNIPLVKIPVPIKLRLADGDSSSMITRHE
ncbi:hypothetical protein BASA60_005671 [Batrachochytrium salamandrivorans]|nr:hypothetical protein BASA60_005671 [Batrachochytrium salamandrivorans]